MLYYANAENFAYKVIKLSGVDPFQVSEQIEKAKKECAKRLEKIEKKNVFSFSYSVFSIKALYMRNNSLTQIGFILILRKRESFLSTRREYQTMLSENHKLNRKNFNRH